VWPVNLGLVQAETS